MNTKQRRTLASLFESPAPANLRWKDIESLCLALGGQVDHRGGGSSRALEVNGKVLVVDAPHPSPEVPRGLVKRIRRFLEEAGVSAASPEQGKR